MYTSHVLLLFIIVYMYFFYTFMCICFYICFYVYLKKFCHLFVCASVLEPLTYLKHVLCSSTSFKLTKYDH